MLNQYETVFILNPVLADADIKKSVKKYIDFMTKAGAEIVFENNWGIKQLGYPIKNKNTGHYYLIEFKAPADLVSKLEVQYKRDENILRFMTTRLDKFAIEYNERKRSGKINSNLDQIKETQEA